jgi:hypothetical protein
MSPTCPVSYSCTSKTRSSGATDLISGSLRGERHVQVAVDALISEQQCRGAEVLRRDGQPHQFGYGSYRVHPHAPPRGFSW